MARIKWLLSWKFLKHLFGYSLGISLLLSYLSPVLHPETASLIPFFGLAFPVILLLNLIYVLFAAIKRSRWSLIIGSVLLLGISFHMRILAYGGGDESYNHQEIKVLSFNVRLFDRYNGNVVDANQNRMAIIDYVRRENPDIACFQEFYHQDKPTSFSTKDTLLQVFSSADYHDKYVHKVIGRQNFGVFILSKLPIIEKGNIVFDESPNSNNFCIYADVVQNQDTFRIYNVHLQSIHFQKDDYALFGEADQQGSWAKSSWLGLVNKLRKAYPARANQAIKVMKHIDKSPYPVVVCGDFNDTPMSYCYSQFNTALTDAFRNSGSGLGITYAGRIPAGRIDYIFHSEALGSNNFEVQKEKLSDHYAISCSIFKK